MASTRTDSNGIQIVRLTPYLKQRIVQLYDSGVNQTQIVNRLRYEENVKVTRLTVHKTIKANKNKDLAVAPKKRGKEPILTSNHLDYISMCLKENGELSASELCLKLKTVFDITVSTTTVKVARQKLGWVSSTQAYCQTVRGANRPKRLEYAFRCITTREKFQDVIFTDQSTIKIQTTTGKCFYLKGHKKTLKGKPKHPFSVHVWAGISRKGPTDIHIFTGIMNSEYYQGILTRFLKPFIEEYYPKSHRFMQDNDPKHVSKSTIEFMRVNNINHWPTPPESPDMNLIENPWAGLKRFIRKTKKPKNKAELISAIKENWYSRVTPELCNKYINHLMNVIPIVIKKNGAASGK